MRGVSVLYDEDFIHEHVDKLGTKITQYYKSQDVSEIVILVVLKGALFFAADLMRAMRVNVLIELISSESYGSKTQSSGIVNISGKIPDLKARHVLIVDDIIDSGRTLEAISLAVKNAGAADIKTCVLLDKMARREVKINADYVGFNVPDEFVVGYGMDYDQMYRGLRYIGVLMDD